MAENVSLNIVLTDDGQPAQRPQLPPQSAAPPAGPGQAQQPEPSPRAKLEQDAGGEQPRAKLGGETPAEARGEQGGSPQTWLGRLKQAGDLLEGGARRFERIMTPLASNDFMGAFRSSMDVASEGLSKLGPYGRAAGAALQSVTGVVESFASVVGSFIERGKQLAQYSPDLAMSNTRSEVRSMMADMREAQELGPGISRMEDAQSELMDILRETLLPLKKWVVEVIASMLETLIQWAKDGYIVAGDIYDQLVAMPSLIHDRFLYKTNSVQNTLDNLKMQAERRRREKPEPKTSPLDDLVDKAMAEIMGRAAGGVARPDPVLGV